MSHVQTNRVAWIAGGAGVGLILLGGIAYFRQRTALAGHLHARTRTPLGRAHTFGHTSAEAPVIGGYSDGNMTTTLRASAEMPIEERLATIQQMVHKSVQDPEMRKLALQITAQCPERDGLCEAKAIYQYVKSRVRYTGDVAPIQMPDGSVEGIDLYQSARRTLEFGGGDCLPADTRLLVKDRGFVPIQYVEPGWEIWGHDAWTRVIRVWSKGVLPLDFVATTVGVFRATRDHKIYASLAGHSIERFAIGEAQPDMELLQPSRACNEQLASLGVVAGRLRLNDCPARIIDIKRDGGDAEVYDISTEDHYVYLPDAGITVSNCDDQGILNATLLALNGITPILRVVMQKGDDDWSHIYAGALLPKGIGNKFIALDTTLPGSNKFGIEVPVSKVIDFPA